MANENDGLSTVQQVEALADQLSVNADQIHLRVIDQMSRYKGRQITDAEHDDLLRLLDDEALLRQKADGMYADAAAFVVKNLGKSQQHLIALTAEAAEKIRKIALIGDVTGLVAGLL